MRNTAIVVLACAVLLSFTACDDEGTTPTLGKTPAQVLEALERAFQDRDAELLERLLDNDFTFHFDPDDVGTIIGDYTIPDSWGREDFLAACSNMFTEAYSIDLAVVYESIDDPAEDATEFTVNNVQVQLLVMIDAQNGYLAQGFCDFRFINDDSAGYDDWLIIDWWDKTGASGTFNTAEPPSLGIILAGFAE